MPPQRARIRCSTVQRVSKVGSALRTPSHIWLDRKSTRLNSSHTVISYAVFCLKKKNCPVIGNGHQEKHARRVLGTDHMHESIVQLNPEAAVVDGAHHELQVGDSGRSQRETIQS